MQGINAEIARQTALARGRRRGRAGDAALRPGERPDQLAALQGGGARLPLLPGARPRAAGADAGDARDRPRARSPSSRPSAAPATSSDFGLAEDTAHLFAFEPEWGEYFEQAAAGAPDPKATAIWVTELRSRDGASGRARARWPSSSTLVSAKTVTAGRGPDDPRQAGRRRRRPGRDRRARGPDGDGGLRRARGDRGQGHLREPGRRRAHPGRQRQGDGRAGRPDHARDQGPRRRRRGQPAAAQRQLGPSSERRPPPGRAARPGRGSRPRA